METKEKTKGKKKKVEYLPGMAPPSIKEIDVQALRYVNCRDERMGMLKDEVDQQGKLEELLKKHGLNSYEFDGLVVEITASTKVKVRKKKDDAVNGDE